MTTIHPMTAALPYLCYWSSYCESGLSGAPDQVSHLVSLSSVQPPLPVLVVVCTSHVRGCSDGYFYEAGNSFSFNRKIGKFLAFTRIISTLHHKLKKKKGHRNEVPTHITEISNILVKLQTEVNPTITQGNNP